MSPGKKTSHLDSLASIPLTACLHVTLSAEKKRKEKFRPNCFAWVQSAHDDEEWGFQRRV